MYKSIYLLFTFTFFTHYLLLAQDMDAGFKYLEKGEFAKAEVYFKDILGEFPENKTARLCYARAIGLNGAPEDALQLLTELNEEYVSDFEIRLNYAEALLWNKDYQSAEKYYETLLTVNNKSFPALLGYANTLSSLKKYEKALEYVNRALGVAANNENAKISKKYIQLGLANSYLQKRKYDQSVKLLKDNLQLFNNDVETMLSLANTYIVAKEHENAREIYDQLKNDKEYFIQGTLGLSLVSHLEGENEKALELSRIILNGINKVEDEALKVQVKQRFVQALIWNRKFKDAELYLNQLPHKVLNESWVLGLYAMLNVYKQDFNKSITYYQSILEKDSSSFDGNLGLANAYKAIGKYNEAYEMALNTLKFYDNQKDAQAFITQLERLFYPSLKSELKYGFDNGDNHSISIANSVKYPYSSKLSYTGYYMFRNTSNAVTNFEANLNYLEYGLQYRLINTVVFNGNIGLNRVGLDTSSYNQFQTRVSFDIKPMKLQQMSVGYSRELESFNAELIHNRIIKDEFFINHNVNTNFKLGWFNQYFYTAQNDDNKRHLYFTSLYYNLFNKPVVKLGVNYQYITFALQRPTVYFSPKRFNMVEVFGEIMKTENNQGKLSWNYGVNAAVGYQYIEDESRQATYRFRLNLGYTINKRLTSGVYYQKSNIASGNTGGFSYSEIGVNLKWIIKERSVFNKNTTKAN